MTAVARHARPRRIVHRTLFRLTADALERWLLAADPARNSPHPIERGAHWVRTAVRFGILCAVSFTVSCEIGWLVLTRLGIVRPWLVTA